MLRFFRWHRPRGTTESVCLPQFKIQFTPLPAFPSFYRSHFNVFPPRFFSLFTCLSVVVFHFLRFLPFLSTFSSRSHCSQSNSFFKGENPEKVSFELSD